MVVSGNLKDYPGNIFLCSHIQEKPDHGSAQALAAKGRKYLYLVKTDAVVPRAGKETYAEEAEEGLSEIPV